MNRQLQLSELVPTKGLHKMKTGEIYARPRLMSSNDRYHPKIIDSTESELCQLANRQSPYPNGCRLLYWRDTVARSLWVWKKYPCPGLVRDNCSLEFMPQVWTRLIQGQDSRHYARQFSLTSLQSLPTQHAPLFGCRAVFFQSLI